MLKNLNPVTIAVPQATREVFNKIAAHTGEQQYQIAARLAQQELKRQERKAGKGGGQL